MISLEERKLALFIQTKLLRKELKFLQHKDHEEFQSDTCKEGKVYPGFMELVANLDSDDK
jgi:hypothetical protein